MGSGHPTDPEKDFTGQEMALVRHLVEEAFSLMGGMQQNGLMGTAFDKEENIKSEQKLKAIADNIRTALLGEEKEEESFALTEENPLAWLVFCDTNSEYDYKVYTCEVEAKQAADENNMSQGIGQSLFEVIPLYRRD